MKMEGFPAPKPEAKPEADVEAKINELQGKLEAMEAKMAQVDVPKLTKKEAEELAKGIGGATWALNTVVLGVVSFPIMNLLNDVSFRLQEHFDYWLTFPQTAAVAGGLVAGIYGLAKGIKKLKAGGFKPKIEGWEE
jgi:hypothetical protein